MLFLLATSENFNLVRCAHHFVHKSKFQEVFFNRFWMMSTFLGYAFRSLRECWCTVSTSTATLSGGVYWLMP